MKLVSILSFYLLSTFSTLYGKGDNKIITHSFDRAEQQYTAMLKALPEPTSHLTVLQLNIWQEGSIVEGGFEAIADEVAQVDADIVFSVKSATTMAPSLYPASLRHLRNVEKLTMENITLWM